MKGFDIRGRRTYELPEGLLETSKTYAFDISLFETLQQVSSEQLFKSERDKSDQTAKQG